MTTYRLFPSTNGPTSPVSYSGNFLAGVLVKVTAAGLWFSGYYHWVPGTNGDTVARKFALWAITGNGTGQLISAATVTSGTLTAGQWNFVALATPIQLAPSTTYCACTGWSATHGFPDSDTTGAGTGAADSFGTGGHVSGITQGPLFAYSDNGKSAPPPYSMSQGLFGTGGTDPTVTMPSAGSNSGNFWMDLQVSDTPPGGYAGSYRIYPNKFDANPATAADTAVNYSVATEFHLSQACTLNKIWYYSPAGTAQLATSARIWSIAGPNSGTSVVTNTSPTWSGAAASGWVSCSFSGVTLPAGSYKASVYNGAATPDGWGAKDASTNYWGTGDGANGFTAGPLFVPGLSSASTAYEYVSGGGGNTPPYTDGSTTEAGQSTFVNGTGDVFPYLYVDGLAQNYWLDVEVTPVTAALPVPPPPVPPGMLSPAAFQFRPLPPPPPAFTPVTVTAAATLSGSGSLAAAAQKTVPVAAVLSGSGTLTAPRSVQFAGTAALSGSGALTASGIAGFAAACTLAGSGSLAAAVAVQFAGASTLSGSGALTVAASVAQPAAAALSGSGTLAAAVSVQFAPSAALGGTGALTAAAAVATGTGAALSGSGALTAGPSLTLAAAAVLAGSGVLTVSVQVIAPVTEPTVAWFAQPAAPRWKCTPSAPRWRIAVTLFSPVAALSLECVNVTWLSDLDGTTVDPTGQSSGQPALPVQFAFPQTSGNYAEPAQPVTWFTGSWLLNGTGRGYVAQALVGPGGLVTLTAGLIYDCWSKVTGSPESPAKFAGTLQVY